MMELIFFTENFHTHSIFRADVLCDKQISVHI